jgi:hypothetical protein
METLTVRVSKRSHELLRELSKSMSEPMTEILDRAVKDFRDRQFLEAVNAAYATLKSDPAAWSEYTRELQEWDATLGDGLEAIDGEQAAGKSEAW